MNYKQDIEVLTRVRNKICNGLYHAEEKEALNDAISALKTLDDMGETMNKLLREEHKNGMNKTMIICIDFDMEGNRRITDIMYDESQSYISVKEYAKDAKEFHHEVYMVDINNYDTSFINAIRRGEEQI